MHLHRSSFLITTLAACLAVTAQELPVAAAAFPAPVVTYQGRLLEATLPVTGTRTFIFSILDSAGTELWNSGAQSVSVNSGLYGVELGASPMPAIPTSALAKPNLKLHVVVSGVVLAPDTDLVPALQARSAFEVSGDFAGDIGGTQNAITLLRLQGVPLDLTTTAPASGQALVYNGTKWVAASVAGTPGATGPAGPKGDAGAAGAKGDTGAAGANGASPFSLSGSNAVFTGGSVMAPTFIGALTGNATTATTAANLSGTPALPDGTTAATQAAGDTTQKLATTAFVVARAAKNHQAAVPPTGANDATQGYAVGSRWLDTVTKLAYECTNVTTDGAAVWATVSAGGVAWGGITGTLSNQTDLGTALSGKVATTTTVNGHALSGNVVVSASDLSTGTLPHAQLPVLVSGDIPNNTASTSGTAAGLSATLAVGSGGTGASTLTANYVLLGNGTSAVQAVAPGAAGQVLTSDGTTWASTAHASFLPSQTSNAGMYLTTDGSSATWVTTLLLGTNNTGGGWHALNSMTTGTANVGLGYNALSSLTTGTKNTALGMDAGWRLSSSSNNIAIGNQAGSAAGNGNYNISIGNAGVADSFNAIRLGTPAVLVNGSMTGHLFAFIAGISGTQTGIQNGPETATQTVVIDANGQLGSKDAAGTRTNIGAAAAGYNSDITTLAGLTTALSVAQGGTGLKTLTANSVVLGNGTSALQVVAPGTSGNVLTSDGSTWASTTPLLFGSNNTGGGFQALNSLSSGTGNVGLGYSVLSSLTTGTNNTALGTNAGSRVTANSNNIAIGNQAGSAAGNGNYNISIGNAGVTDSFNAIRLGTPGVLVNGSMTGHLFAFIAGISGTQTGIQYGAETATQTVVIDANGQLGSKDAAGTRTNIGAAGSGANGDITSLSSLTTALSVAQGGTGGSTATGARASLSAAASGANSDITGLSGLTTALTVDQGGTGAKTFTTNSVLLGNGTSAVQTVAPSTYGNVLTSNGTTWTSAAAAAPLPSDSTFNTKGGTSALAGISSGTNNTAFGYLAGNVLTTGSDNTAIGQQAGTQNITGSQNVYIGSGAMPDTGAGNNRIAIGYGAHNTLDNSAVIGNSAMTKISGAVAWSLTSDRREKENIRPLGLGLDFILKLRPVTYNMLQKPGFLQEGLIAQDVEAAAESLSATFHGVNRPTTPEDRYSLSYATFVMPLINAAQELKAENDALKTRTETQQTAILSLTNDIDTLKAQVASILARLPQ